MSFIADLCIGVLEWIIAKAMALGVKQYQQIESDEEIKKQADLDSQALGAAKDTAGRVAALEKITNDTFNPTSKSGK